MGQRPGSFASSNDRNAPRGPGGNYHQHQMPDNGQMMAQHMDHQQRYPPHPMGSNRFREASPQPGPAYPDSYVFNVEGLSSPSWNCERLFNLLCLYGNVSRVCLRRRMIRSINAVLFARRLSSWNPRKEVPWSRWIIVTIFNNIWKVSIRHSFSGRHLSLCKNTWQSVRT